jgi:hypothetical protein
MVDRPMVYRWRAAKGCLWWRKLCQEEFSRVLHQESSGATFGRDELGKVGCCTELDRRQPGSEEAIMIRKTISTSKPATRLIELAQRLSAKENYQLARRIANGARVVVFHVDGERATLAEMEVAMPISGA